MEAATKQEPRGGECPHCGDDTGECISMRCLKCEALLCCRCVTPVLASSPYYPNKHRVRGHTCGPVQPLLLPE